MLEGSFFTSELANRHFLSEKGYWCAFVCGGDSGETGKGGERGVQRSATYLSLLYLFIINYFLLSMIFANAHYYDVDFIPIDFWPWLCPGGMTSL